MNKWLAIGTGLLSVIGIGWWSGQSRIPPVQPQALPSVDTTFWAEGITWQQMNAQGQLTHRLDAKELLEVQSGLQTFLHTSAKAWQPPLELWTSQAQQATLQGQALTLTKQIQLNQVPRQIQLNTESLNIDLNNNHAWNSHDTLIKMPSKHIQGSHLQTDLVTGDHQFKHHDHTVIVFGP